MTSGTNTPPWETMITSWPWCRSSLASSTMWVSAPPMSSPMVAMRIFIPPLPYPTWVTVPPKLVYLVKKVRAALTPRG